MPPTATTVDEDRLVVLIHDASVPTHDWSNAAACLGMSGHPYFPHDHAEPPPEALRVCGDCSVAAHCLASSLIHEAVDGLRDGWWGGVSPEGRDILWASVKDRVVDLPTPVLNDPAAIARRLRSDGSTVRAIADELACTERTVYRYLSSPAA